MADIDRDAFARAVARRLAQAGLSYRKAVARWPALNAGMLSRACCARPLSAGNYLLVCRVLELTPIVSSWSLRAGAQPCAISENARKNRLLQQSCHVKRRACDMNERCGLWMQTYSGRRFWPLDPRPEEVHIEDIAHALAHQCRYAGHVLRYYSVAEHCVHLSHAVSPDHALWALLHDASEAYLVDVPRPVKPFLGGYAQAEARVMEAVARRFGLVGDMPAEVAALDTRIIADERANLAPCEARWDFDARPLGISLCCWEPAEAKRRFLARFAQLAGGTP